MGSVTAGVAFDRAKVAASLRSQSAALSTRLAALVADWPKYAADYAADPAAFAALETQALVDYVSRYVETGDDVFRHLYVGEKAKQFHDPSADAAARAAREAPLLAGERAIFVDAVGDDQAARAFVATTFDAIEHALTAEAKAKLQVLFVGDCLHLDVVGFLTAPALEDGIRLEPTFISSRDAADMRAQLSGIAGQAFDVIFFSPFTYAMLSDYEALQRPRGVLQPSRLKRHIEGAVADALSLFDTLADLFDCPIVAHAPAPIFRQEDRLSERVRDLVTRPARATATRRLNAALRERADARGARGQSVFLIDETEVIGAAGMVAAGRFLYRSYLQHPAAFGAMVAPVYRDILFAVAYLLKRKVMVCDLDNTLWEGVIGEGLGVKHHHDRQAPLLALKERGVVLAINSKNDPAKAIWEAAAGQLALDHFVSRQVNWDPKPINMRRIAEHLNLKEKDFVFIDDRTDERAMVEAEFPAMLTLDALDPRSWRLLGTWAGLLPSKPGADRTDFYRQRDERQAFIAAEAEGASEQRTAMFEQLGLKLVIREAAADDVARVTDLINRTNQFNMTGARIGRKRVEELVASNSAWVLIADASDRFGTMGTIGVLIAEREPDRITIPTFVLSCRVFGYGMEYALIEEARRHADRGDTLYGPLVETPLNQPCREVYPTAGFKRVEGGWALGEAADHLIPLASWLTIERLAATSTAAEVAA